MPPGLAGLGCTLNVGFVTIGGCGLVSAQPAKVTAKPAIRMSFNPVARGLALLAVALAEPAVEQVRKARE